MSSSKRADRNLESVESPWIPDGFKIVIGPDDQHYLVPEFFVSALHQTFDAHRQKEILEVSKGSGSVCFLSQILFLRCRWYII